MEQGGGDVGQLEPFHIPNSRVLISQSPKRRVQSVPLGRGTRTPDIFLVGQRPPSAEIRTGPQAVAHEGCVSCSVQCAATFILRATRSATITQPRYVFPEGIVGITDASTTRRPSTPSTRQSASSTDPIGHVLVMWP